MGMGFLLADCQRLLSVIPGRPVKPPIGRERKDASATELVTRSLVDQYQALPSLKPRHPFPVQAVNRWWKEICQIELLGDSSAIKVKALQPVILARSAAPEFLSS
jgi:hypothetical protein